MKGIEVVQADVAASFQKAVTDVLVGNAMKAIDEFKMDKFAIAGGVDFPHVTLSRFSVRPDIPVQWRVQK